MGSSLFYRISTVESDESFCRCVWCAAAARAVLGSSSRFGAFNSRLAPNKFPFSRLRELVGNGLIWLAVFDARTTLFGLNRKNSRFHGNNRECCRYPRRGWRQLSGTGGDVEAVDP